MCLILYLHQLLLFFRFFLSRSFVCSFVVRAVFLTCSFVLISCPCDQKCLSSTFFCFFFWRSSCNVMFVVTERSVTSMGGFKHPSPVKLKRFFRVAMMNSFHAFIIDSTWPLRSFAQYCSRASLASEKVLPLLISTNVRRPYDTGI